MTEKNARANEKTRELKAAATFPVYVKHICSVVL